MSSGAPSAAAVLPVPRDSAADHRVHLEIRGAVQGVGFRPHVHHLAHRLGLAGWVLNCAGGVEIEVEGSSAGVERFIEGVASEAPALAQIRGIVVQRVQPRGERTFRILASRAGGEERTLVLPDIATCPDCIRELFDPRDRRHRYPFTNCTHCGPRFTILDRLPYDRANTSMAQFTMCPACQAEYENPINRRFHAQPNACPVCGPRVEMWSASGKVLCAEDEAVRFAVTAIREGLIVAVKGLGGFQLLVDATKPRAIRRLRERKIRPDKPLALMVRDLGQARALCHLGETESDLLTSPMGPIVLMRARERHGGVAVEAIAPRNPNLGIMLPTTPLHHLLLHDLGTPVVATSGNHSDEPICIDEREAVRRLEGIADLFLVHNRPIRRHVDDSIARVVCGEVQVLRRARGWAPLPLLVDRPREAAVAFGAHQKSACAISVGREVILGQHIGDLETVEAVDALGRAVADLQWLHRQTPRVAVCDLHPDYESTRLAERSGLPRHRVQHHVAHALACAAENGLAGPALAVAWDGTGLGTDGTVWGGEFFRLEGAEATRIAHLRTFGLPGGDLAAREPRRAALGAMMEFLCEDFTSMRDLETVRAFSPEMLSRLTESARLGINPPRTSSAGRLFDAVASLSGLRQVASFEGQAAMELEFAAAAWPKVAPFDHRVTEGSNGMWVLDWEPTLRGVIGAAGERMPVGEIAARFHHTLLAMILSVAQRAELRDVLLTGGCFQSRWLTEHAVTRLRDEGFAPHFHRRVPPNDGGIALGQIMALEPIGEED